MIYLNKERPPAAVKRSVKSSAVFHVADLCDVINVPDIGLRDWISASVRGVGFQKTKIAPENSFEDLHNISPRVEAAWNRVT